MLHATTSAIAAGVAESVSLRPTLRDDGLKQEAHRRTGEEQIAGLLGGLQNGLDHSVGHLERRVNDELIVLEEHQLRSCPARIAGGLPANRQIHQP